MHFDPYTKEGRHAALKAFASIAAAAGFPVVDETDFSKGSAVKGRSEDKDWAVTVGNRGVQAIFTGYGWQSKKTADERKAIEAAAFRVNASGTFANLYAGLTEDEKEMVGSYLRERGFFE